MNIVGRLAAVAVILQGLAVGADEAKPDGPKAIAVKLESMEKGNKLSGTVALGAIRVEGELGTLEVPASKLIEVGFAADTAPGGKAIHRLTTIDGEVIVGVIVAPETIEVATRYGAATTNWNGVRTLRFAANANSEGGRVEQPIPTFRVRVEMTGGDRVAGGLPVETLSIDCQLGSLDLDPEKIRTIRFEAEWAERSDVGVSKTGTIETTDGRTLAGKIDFPDDWLMGTDLGLLTLDADKVKEIRFDGPEEPAESPAPSPEPPAGPKPGPADPSEGP